MPKLAIDGGEPEVKEPLEPFSTIGHREIAAVRHIIDCGYPLSGYLAGQHGAGFAVDYLEERWAEKMKVKHAIACNSATSGLLAAAHAIGLQPGDRFLCPALTMSATAAAPMILGATPIFVDSDAWSYNANANDLLTIHDWEGRSAVFITHLFGYAIDEGWWRGWAHQNGMRLVVDAAQAPFAKEDGVYAGTSGDISVFSLNVHKHIQCGEGGIIVTNEDDFAERCRLFVNHGECAGDTSVGLNLRMSELCAAVALAQFERVDDIIARRRAIAESLSKMVEGIPGIIAPVVDPDCEHVYYCWAPRVDKNRDRIVAALQAEGVPVRAGYSDPLYRLPAFKPYHRHCPIAEILHDYMLILYENCAWDPTAEQIAQIGNAFAKVMEVVNGEAVGRDGPNSAEEAAAQRSS